MEGFERDIWEAGGRGDGWKEGGRQGLVEEEVGQGSDRCVDLESSDA